MDTAGVTLQHLLGLLDLVVEGPLDAPVGDLPASDVIRWGVDAVAVLIVQVSGSFRCRIQFYLSFRIFLILSETGVW